MGIISRPSRSGVRRMETRREMRGRLKRRIPVEEASVLWVCSCAR
jgi:hypothetical protein